MRPGPKPETPPGARQPPLDVVVGRIVRPHGVRGGLLADLSLDLLPSLHEGMNLYLGEGRRSLRLRQLRRHGGMHLISFDGLSDREAAEALRGLALRLPADRAVPLPPNVYYHWQILGLKVVSDAGEELGTVGEIIETGANDVYVVRGPARRELLLPAIEPVIRRIDLDKGEMTVHLLDGLRDEPGSVVA